MKKIPFPFMRSGIIVTFSFLGFMIWGIPYFFRPAPFEAGTSTFGSQTVLARVTKIVEEGQITLNAKPQPYQVMQVDVLEGEYKGVSFQVDYGKRALRTDNFRFTAGDQIHVIINKTPNNSILITG